ncbi:MAG: hypothetical protein MJ025_06010 [Victivallaceae bacterium]|nr:hypothetical protein [Victivallaceae bacterium]
MSDHTGRHGIPVAEIIAECDRLLDLGKFAELGEKLRYWANRAAETGDKSGELTMRTELAGFCRNNGLADEGLAAADRSLELLAELGIECSESGGTILVDAGTAYCAFGRIVESIDLFNRAEKSFLHHLKRGDYRFAALYNNMAAAYLALGDEERAGALYRKAADTCSYLPDRAMTLTILAKLVSTRDGGDIEADRLLEEAKYNLDDKSTPRDGRYARACAKCAETFDELGWFVDAAELRERAKK